MIIAANLKCNHTRASFEAYAKTLNAELKDIYAKSSDGKDEISLEVFSQNETSAFTPTGASINKSEHQVIVFPPSVAFLEPSKCEYFTQGAQNFYPANNGSFTGEIGADMLSEFGIKTVLIGHSERRGMNESDELIKAKFEFAKNKGYQIIFCIGEDDITYMNGSSKEFLSAQLELIDLNYKKLIIAYEPIFAIGTGVSAKTEYIAEILEHLRTLTKAPLLYGGSVNDKNIASITSLEHCGGVLIGSASWEAQNFIKLALIAML